MAWQPVATGLSILPPPTALYTLPEVAPKAGGSLRDVQLLAGHRSIQTTQRYIDGDTLAQAPLQSTFSRALRSCDSRPALHCRSGPWCEPGEACAAFPVVSGIRVNTAEPAMNRSRIGIDQRPYPTVTLAQARERRESARKLIANGTDPGVQRRLEKIAAATGGNGRPSMLRHQLIVASPG